MRLSLFVLLIFFCTTTNIFPMRLDLWPWHLKKQVLEHRRKRIKELEEFKEELNKGLEGLPEKDEFIATFSIDERLRFLRRPLPSYTSLFW